MAIWDEGNIPVDLDRHEREQDACYIGVDLSSTLDLSGIVIAWPDGDEGYDIARWPFVPAANLRRRGEIDQADYTRWVAEGFLTATPGDVIDHRAIEAKIKELCGRFNVMEIAFDPHLANVMLASLFESGYPAVACRQGWVTQAPAVLELERALIARRLRHGGHPVLREHIARVAVETDRAGNQVFHKGKSRDRIDLAAALWMAVGRAHAAEIRPSPYETNELLFV
jgi:phage terminase large subunit-like protein